MFAAFRGGARRFGPPLNTPLICILINIVAFDSIKSLLKQLLLQLVMTYTTYNTLHMPIGNVSGANCKFTENLQI